MNIAVLSGKGGVGKTFLAVNMAAACAGTVYVDCDVEEPNGHLFFRPRWQTETKVNVPVPVWNAERCTGCRQCIEFCRFHALAMVGPRVLVVEELCHSCGGCVLVCPRRAFSETQHDVGSIKYGWAGTNRIVMGQLRPGEYSGVPIIRQLLDSLPSSTLNILDCPPGSACNVMETVQSADFCILVTDSTTFGADNLKLVHELVRVFGKPAGVVVNKDMGGSNPADEYASSCALPVLSHIPFQTDLARSIAKGCIAIHDSQNYEKIFQKLLADVEGRARRETSTSSQR